MNQSDRILRALREGARTSRDVALALHAGRRGVSVALCRLADLGLVARAGVVAANRPGRPFVTWRLPSSDRLAKRSRTFA